MGAKKARLARFNSLRISDGPYLSQEKRYAPLMLAKAQLLAITCKLANTLKQNWFYIQYHFQLSEKETGF